MIKLFTSLIFLFVYIHSWSQPIVKLNSTNGVRLIGESIKLYEDVEGKESIETILTSPIQKKFNASTSEIPSFNITQSIIWAKMRFTTNEIDEWYTEYGLPCADEINFYQLTKSGIKRQASGIVIPFHKAARIGHRALFELDFSVDDTITCYMSVKDISPIRLLIRTGNLESFFRHDHTINFWHGAFYGVMMLMAIYNLFLFITNRNRVYIYYVLYISFSSIFIAFFNGYATLFSDFVLWIFIHLPTLFPALFGIFGLLFTMEFLYSKKYAPVLHKLMIYFMISVIIPVLLPMINMPHMGIIVIQFYGLILSILSIATGIVVLRKGYRPAKFYVVGFGSYMIGLIFVICADFIGTTNEFISMYSFPTGAAIEAVILSFAIGDKLNYANKEKTIAQALALESAQKNEQLIREQNITLEKKVKERTTEINNAKDEIEAKQKEILDSIHYAKRIQQALLPNDKQIAKILNNK